MIVLFIILTIAGMMVVRVIGQRERASKEAAYGYIKILGGGIERYAFDMGQYPTTEQGLGALTSCPQEVSNPAKWGGPYLDRTATSIDPWGFDYQYVYPGNNGDFDIWSYGPGGPSGNKPIGNWMGKEEIY
jgi:general secretion pathway protein G